MDDRPGRMAATASPQAVAAAERIKAEQGFDPLDENTLDQAVTGYHRLMRRVRRWSMVSVLPLSFVAIMIVVSVPADGQGARPAGFALAGVGAVIAAFPLSKCVRAFRGQGQTLRVIRAYQNVLRATEPDRWRGNAAVRHWRRSQGLR
jgi:hypothetical protein